MELCSTTLCISLTTTYLLYNESHILYQDFLQDFWGQCDLLGRGHWGDLLVSLKDLSVRLNWWFHNEPFMSGAYCNLRTNEVTVALGCNQTNLRTGWGVRETCCLPLPPIWNTEYVCILNTWTLTFIFQIYQSSVVYSPDAIQTSGGYFHLGRVFLMEGKMDVATSLHSRVS